MDWLTSPRGLDRQAVDGAESRAVLSHFRPPLAPVPLGLDTHLQTRECIHTCIRMCVVLVHEFFYIHCPLYVHTHHTYLLTVPIDGSDDYTQSVMDSRREAADRGDRGGSQRWRAQCLAWKVGLLQVSGGAADLFVEASRRLSATPLCLRFLG